MADAGFWFAKERRRRTTSVRILLKDMMERVVWGWGLWFIIEVR